MVRPIFLKWLLPCVMEWLIIAALLTAGYLLDSWAVWFAIMVMLGSRQHALAILGHEGAHYLISRNRWLNDSAAELLCFWPLGVGIGGYREHHFRHHRLIGTPDDAEWVDRESRAWRLPKSRWQIAAYFLGDLIGLGLLSVIRDVLLKVAGGRRAIDWLGPIVFLSGVAAVFVWSGLWIVPVVWFAALLTSFWAFFRLRIWTEHIGTSSTHRIMANWWQRWFIVPHNTWYHWEHHESASVPFWALPDTRRLMSSHTYEIGDLFRLYGMLL